MLKKEKDDERRSKMSDIRERVRNLEEYVHKPSIYELTREGFCLVSSMKERVRWRGKRKKRDGRRAGLVPRILALVGG